MIDKKVAIIGAGLLGCSIAYQLSQFGFSNITIFDKNSSIAAEASGNYAGMLAPYLTSDNNLSDQFHTLGYHTLLDFIAKYSDDLDISAKGIVKVLSSAKELARYQKIFIKRNISTDLAKLITSDQASEIVGQNISHSAVYYPKAVSVSPISLCQLWVDISSANVRLNTCITNLHKNNDRWSIEFNSNKIDYDIVLFAGGYQLFQKLDVLKHIPVFPSQGQLTMVDDFIDIKTTVMDKSYIIPNQDGTQTIGATFRSNDDLTGEIRELDDLSNLTNIADIFNIEPRANIVKSRVATRCVTSDHLPIVGPIADYNRFTELFHKPLSMGYPKSKMPQPEYLDGLFVSSGFGSKGLCSSLLSAQIISSFILQSKSVVSDCLLTALSPQRFWVREFKKAK